MVSSASRPAGWGGEGALLVADATRVQLLEVTATAPPIWYTPLLAGLVASLIIGLVAVLIPTPRPAPTLHVSASDMSVAAQKARRRVLYESLEELNRMRDNNQVPENAYLGRKKALLGQLSQVTAALIALGEPLQVETFACPHCGGTLELGTDRCEYCGQVTIV